MGDYKAEKCMFLATQYIGEIHTEEFLCYSTAVIFN